MRYPKRPMIAWRRRKFPLRWSLLLLWIFASGACDGNSRRASAAARGDDLEGSTEVENLLLITIDTLRADVLGFAGAEEVSTPVIDRLAASGRIYTHAHAHNVVTLPSHANILTGLYPYQHGIRDNSGFTLPAGVPTAATLLKASGFATAAFVAAYPLDARYGLARGFDVYGDDYPKGSDVSQFLFPERPGYEVVDQALNWWRENRERRRFLWVHLFEPHAPYEPSEPFASRHAGEPYLGEVEEVDAILAPLLEPFLAGAEPPTLIILTSDHGEALGDHGELTHGLFAYEPTLRVPLIVWGSGHGSGAQSRAARHVDLLPTMLSAVGIEPPMELPGVSLLAPAPSEPSPVTYFEALTGTLTNGWAPLRGILRDRLKLISLPIPELYDLQADPAERDNLFSREEEQGHELEQLLPIESVWPPVPGEVSAEESAALQALGYLTGHHGSKTSFGEADDPKNLIVLENKIHRVIQLYQQQRLNEALELAREVIAARPDMGAAYSVTAQVLLEKGEMQEAIALMQRAMESGVASESLIRQLGLSLAEAGRSREALVLLEPRAESGDRDLLNVLAVVLSEAGRQRDARRLLLDLVAADPGDPVAHENLALVALREGRWLEARDHAQRALAQNPALGLSWNYLGTALYNLGQRSEALAALQRSVEQDPGNFDALYNVAAVALELGDRSAARSALLRFLAEAPRDEYGADIEQARAWLRQIGE